MLKMKNISGTLQDCTSTFSQGKDYITFITDHPGFGGTKGDMCLTTYLTYLGLMRLLFVRKHPIAIKFQQWATETLFTIKHGTAEAKEKLAGKLLGVGLSGIKAFLATDAETLPVIYLFIIGRLGDLRDKMHIDVAKRFDDDGLVAKFGYTTDLKSRAADHARNFKEFGAEVSLKCHVRIEPAHLSAAESDLRTYFKEKECTITDNKAYKELVVLNETFVKRKIVDVYRKIGRTYGGRFSELSTLETEIKYLKCLLTEKDKTISLLSNSIVDKDTKIDRKDAIIEKLTTKIY